jgi:hypothetical protein
VKIIGWHVAAQKFRSTHAQPDVDAINAAEERELPEGKIFVAQESQFAQRVC